MEWFNPFGGEGGGGPSDVYTKAETNELLNQKVDKESGKGLSTEDYTTEDKTKVDNLGTAAERDVPTSGNARNTEVVMGNDTRLSDARPASDVSEWAKALTKPSYSYSEITNTPTVDAAPASGSNNLVSSGGVYTALDDKVDKINGKGLSTNDYTDEEKAQVATNASDIAELKGEHVELTQAEYNALGAQVYTDNKNYFITDAEPEPTTYIYGFHIDPDESSSSDAVTYLKDAIGMTPAAMGSTSFNYGSWKNAFFMPRPCMLKFDGTVDYYLNPNDYSKKEDGTASDITNFEYQGNAMMEWSIIWYKFVAGAASGEGEFYVSNKQVDSSYKCWSNINSDGEIAEHFYTSIYNGTIYDGKMRSLSGVKLTPWSTTAYSTSDTYEVDAIVNYQNKAYRCITAVTEGEAFDSEKWVQYAFNGQTTVAEEVAAAAANDTTVKSEWYSNVWADKVLIGGLLILMSKSLDPQGSFGRGVDTGSQAGKESHITGSLNNKGLFYGSTANGTTAVKVFGMENWYSLVWDRTAGLIGGANNTYLYKMTYGTSDGSTANGYNTSGNGYLLVGNKPTTNNYVSKMQFGLWGWLPIETGAYSTLYYKDYYANGTGYCNVGGASNSGASGGAFYVSLDRTASFRYWSVAARTSCKPCRKG